MALSARVTYEPRGHQVHRRRQLPERKRRQMDATVCQMEMLRAPGDANQSGNSRQDLIDFFPLRPQMAPISPKCIRFPCDCICDALETANTRSFDDIPSTFFRGVCLRVSTIVLTRLPADQIDPLGSFSPAAQCPSGNTQLRIQTDSASLALSSPAPSFDFFAALPEAAKLVSSAQKGNGQFGSRRADDSTF